MNNLLKEVLLYLLITSKGSATKNYMKVSNRHNNRTKIQIGEMAFIFLLPRADANHFKDK